MKKGEGGNWVEVRKDGVDKRISVSKGGIGIKRAGKPVKAGGAESGTVYLAVDSSGSMEGEKLAQAKRGAVGFAKEARRKGYQTGLIAFDSYATLLCSPRKDISVLQKALDPVVVGGTTNMTQAIELASEKLRSKKGKRVLVMVTDGAPDNDDDCLAAGRRAKKEGIEIITVGTDDADHGFLKKLASRNDLATLVQKHQLGEGIAATAKLLQLSTGK